MEDAHRDELHQLGKLLYCLPCHPFSHTRTYTCAFITKHMFIYIIHTYLHTYLGIYKACYVLDCKVVFGRSCYCEAKVKLSHSYKRMLQVLKVYRRCVYTSTQMHMHI